jgi:hypothetical protein
LKSSCPEINSGKEPNTPFFKYTSIQKGRTHYKDDIKEKAKDSGGIGADGPALKSTILFIVQPIRISVKLLISTKMK